MSQFRSFREFYPYYLGEHANLACRRLHVIGSTGVLLVVAATVFTGNPWLLLLVPLIGYGFAWVGHFAFEKNKPATFRHPFYSLMGDWVMYFDVLRGRVKI